MFSVYYRADVNLFRTIRFSAQIARSFFKAGTHRRLADALHSTTKCKAIHLNVWNESTRNSAANFTAYTSLDELAK